MPAPLGQLLANINLPTAIAAAALVFLVILVIRIGKVLIMAGVFGMLAGGVSLGQGQPPGTGSGSRPSLSSSFA